MFISVKLSKLSKAIKINQISELINSMIIYFDGEIVHTIS